MEEKNNDMNEIVKLMHKTGKAMEMTRQKQASIDTLKSDIMEETRPMMVEKMKEDIKQGETGKKEFDEMTKNAMIEAKTNILKIREASEKEYQARLMETMQKQKRIEQKLASIKSKELPKEKLEMTETAAKNALNKVKDEMKDFQTKHFTKRAKLDEFEKNINSWAIELGVEKEIANVKLEEEKPEPANVEQTNTEPANTKPTNAEPTNAEPANAEQTNAEPVNAEPANAEPTNAEQTNAEPTNAEPANVDQTNADSTKPEESKGKLIRVKAEGKTYKFEYENGQEEVKKMGIFRNLAEKIKLAVSRNNYGITLKQAMLVDANIVKNISEDDKEKYLSYMTEQGKGDCFTIEYADKEGKQAKRLEAVNDKWVKLLEASIKKEEMLNGVKRSVDQKNAENAQVIYDSKRHDERQAKLNETFGVGFDQHDNPPQPPKDENKDVQEEIAEGVKKILEGNDTASR